MLVFLAFRGQGSVTNYSVLGMIDNLFAGIDVIGAQSGHAHAQVHNPLVLKLHRQAVAHSLTFQSRFIGHLALQLV